MLSKADKQKILCGTLLALGIGLCIGSVWLPALLVVGVPILSVGLGIAADIYDDKDRNTINNIYNYAAGNIPDTMPAAVAKVVRVSSPIKKVSDKTLGIVTKAVNILRENVKRKRKTFNHNLINDQKTDEKENENISSTDEKNISKDKIVSFTFDHIANVKNKPLQKSKNGAKSTNLADDTDNNITHEKKLDLN